MDPGVDQGDQIDHPTLFTLYKISAYLVPQIQVASKGVEKTPNGLKSNFQILEEWELENENHLCKKEYSASLQRDKNHTQYMNYIIDKDLTFNLNCEQV